MVVAKLMLTDFWHVCTDLYLIFVDAYSILLFVFIVHRWIYYPCKRAFEVLSLLFFFFIGKNEYLLDIFVGIVSSYFYQVS